MVELKGKNRVVSTESIESVESTGIAVVRHHPEDRDWRRHGVGSLNRKAGQEKLDNTNDMI